ncbi:branched-chain amino acid ABC transporter permease [Meridianimarinicoccus roseus]|jgi:branched-chain amino acid transport system permease protein|uniref:Branched-chain amino acid ABC transporter permease n=1 Tax=Meridianimarinicoccus roseus TaxID=2072018 RepID=A0A2V2LKN0_9RHOB|nr:branched-chain amino acid ABC transporter permease [Meridianimarinicoccus roseus]PWR04104.1 branched-chain amino acid ABC transporter permease [Meridianimarinicoccus roseus]
MIRLLSGDGPGGRLVSIAVLAIFLSLAFAPFVFEGTRALDTAARICVLIVLAASFDLLLGYAGIVSFAHTMFFGLGAYGVALSSLHMGRGFEALAAGTAAGAGAAAVLALVIGLFSLRVRAIFFAMITLAVASAVAVLVSQLSQITGGEDGLTYRIPRALTAAADHGTVPAFAIGGDLVLGGQRITGKIANYYLVFGGALLLFLLMLRLVNSPFGRVLQAIRENDYRAESIGYSVVRYRIAISVISAVIAALAGSLFAIWLRYVGPDTTLSFELMIDILLMVVIGGMGTLWGAVIGAVLLVLAQSYLRDVMGSAAERMADLPLLPQLLDPDRWLLWLGLLFVLSVYFFPSGIVGRLRGRR